MEFRNVLEQRIWNTSLNCTCELHQWTTHLNYAFELHFWNDAYELLIRTPHLNSTFFSWRICSEKLHADFDAVWLWMISWSSTLHLASRSIQAPCVQWNSVLDSNNTLFFWMTHLMDTFVWHIWWTHLYDTFDGHICMTHLFDTFDEHICMTHLYDTFDGHICKTHLKENSS